MEDEWNVIPIIKDTKKPAVKWKVYLNKQFPREELERHNGNRAVICGRTSNNLVIFDLDYKDNNKHHFAKIFSQFYETFPKLVDTYITETPHGHHFYYYIKGDCPSRSPRQDTQKDTLIKLLLKRKNPILTKVTNFPKLLKGVDILGQGGYALIPLSYIEDGAYKPMNNKAVKLISRPVFNKIKGFFLKNEPYKKRMREPFFDLLMGKKEIEEQAQITGKLEWAYWKYLYLEIRHRLELYPNDVFAILKKNQPCFNIDKTIIQLQYINLDDAPLTNEVLKEYFPTNDKPKEERATQVDEPLYVTIGSYLQDKYNIVVMDDSEELLRRDGNVFFYDLNNFYSDLADEIVDNNKSIIYLSNLVMKWIKMKYRFSRENFCYDNWLINFQNGYYDIKTKTFYPKDEFKDKLFCYAVPHDYINEEADCPKFKTLLLQWLGKNNKVIIDDIFEMIGYSMTMNVGMKLAFFIYGPSHAGKTQFQTILEHVVGHQNRGNTSLQRMSKNEFGTDGLAYKIINMVGDMSNLEVNDVSAFKTLTGGDEYVRAEPKGKGSYQFRNISKIWYNGNHIPMLKADDQAFYNRWLLIEFPNEFPMFSDFTIKNIGKIISGDENEIKGIIRESLIAVRRLYKRKWFRKEIIRNTKHIWKYNAEPLYGFLSDKTKHDPERSIECVEFRTELNKYFIRRGMRPLSSHALTQQLERYNIYKIRETFDDRNYVYVGIKWKEKLDDFIVV